MKLRPSPIVEECQNVTKHTSGEHNYWKSGAKRHKGVSWWQSQGRLLVAESRVSLGGRDKGVSWWQRQGRHSVNAENTLAYHFTRGLENENPPSMK